MTARVCSVEACNAPGLHADGLCGRHHRRQLNLGDPEASLGSRTPRGLWLTDKGLGAIGVQPSREVPLLVLPWRNSWRDKRKGTS